MSPEFKDLQWFYAGSLPFVSVLKKFDTLETNFLHISLKENILIDIINSTGSIHTNTSQLQLDFCTNPSINITSHTTLS